ncbi:MAG: MAPEG family protein [Alphaproteobacteria bacterium]|nr:MAPEG family protein [Alphaproteobacteria bacterium]
MLAPLLALVVWTLIVWVWMYALRIPAMQKAGIDPQDALHPGSLSGLPRTARCAADNYNHLHEQPTLFYALALYGHLSGSGDGPAVLLAWTYVATRIAHSFAQIVLQKVAVRFATFALGSIILMALAAIFVAASVS